MKFLKKLHYYLYIIIWCLSVINLTTSLSYADEGTPSILINEAIYDFGQADQGKAITHVFNVRNTGDKPLIIKRIKGG